MTIEIKPDIIATIYFYKTEDGGRKGPTRNDYFSCPLIYKDNYYDCRLLLKDIGKVFPGDTIKVPIKFTLSKIMQELKVGDTFKLWEGGIKGEGKVDEILK